MLKKAIVINLLLFFTSLLLGQDHYLPNNDQRSKDLLDRLDVYGKVGLHIGLGGVNLNIDSINIDDSNLVLQNELRRLCVAYNFKPSYSKYRVSNVIFHDRSSAYTTDGFWQKLKDRDNIGYQYNKNGSTVQLLPVLDVSINRDQVRRGFTNTRGIEAKGNIDGKISFYTLVTENQLNAPRYIRERIALTGALPGENWAKTFKQGEVNISDLDEVGAIDFFSTRAYINFKLSKSIDIQFGQDKNFLGYGYRSLVLSDNATSYPFLKMETQVGNVRYQNLIAEMNNAPNRLSNNMIPKKYFASHTFSWNVNERLNVSFFENVMYARGDTNVQSHFEWQYMNPVIFYRAVEHGLGSPDNASLGYFAKYDLFNKIKLYTQFYLDDISFQELKKDVKYSLFGMDTLNNPVTSVEDTLFFKWTNKWSTQYGLKYYDIVGIPFLDFQLEHNRVRPFTYSHTDQRQAYIHNSQALAHPFGANFIENIMILSYRPKPKIYAEFKWINVVYGVDTANSNWGSDITKNYNSLGENYDRPSPDPVDYYNSLITKGPENRLNSFGFLMSYEIKYNLIVEIEVKDRRITNDRTTDLLKDRIVILGLRWNIGRKDFDF